VWPPLPLSPPMPMPHPASVFRLWKNDRGFLELMTPQIEKLKNRRFVAI